MLGEYAVTEGLVCQKHLPLVSRSIAGSHQEPNNLIIIYPADTITSIHHHAVIHHPSMKYLLMGQYLWRYHYAGQAGLETVDKESVYFWLDGLLANRPTTFGWTTLFKDERDSIRILFEFVPQLE